MQCLVAGPRGGGGGGAEGTRPPPPVLAAWRRHWQCLTYGKGNITMAMNRDNMRA